MADVDMTDAPSASGSAPVKKATGKAKVGVTENGADGKKRFEVKKVKRSQQPCKAYISPSNWLLVERGSFMGVGYCCGQLRDLSKSHHGSL